ncbi:tRNA-dihydrouridine synthase [Halomarina oriensis]|uniref:Dihydropyrimidine dehydrogenase n=1 Tax=Halomarina oriensis TaxID=671145 RepID=A0A6B0GMC9_9EURY|nr:tRNA-dihydrouridine synthase [Halomarina oriensis]MWG36012.1 dihydropyrimidine dehydrogenase [Halomarina oriensis]
MDRTSDSAAEFGGFEPRVALASLSGAADARWALAASEFAGCAFLGGVALDEATRTAARALVARDREEFLPAAPVAFVESQLAALDDAPIRAGVNVRSTTLDPIRDVAEVCVDHDALLELNAHCRQDEMCAAGVGESLLRDADRLCEQVRVASDTGATVSVKVRAEVDGVVLPVLAPRLVEAGASVLHVDAMDSESVVGAVVESCDAFVIANNGVRDRRTVREYLDDGADAVSVGRPSDDPRVLRRVREATDAWFAGHQRPTRSAERR